MKKEQYEGVSLEDELWLAKLSEEVGEVARARVDAIRHPTMKRRHQRQVIKELEHVEFIARCFREDLQRRGYERTF